MDLEQVPAHALVAIGAVERHEGIVATIEDGSDQGVEAEAEAGAERSEALHLLDLLEPALEARVVLRDPAPLDRAADRALQQRAHELVLHQVVLGAGGERGDGRRLVGISREHHDRQRRVGRAQPHDRVDSLAVRQVQIEDHGVDVAAREAVEPRLEGRHVFELDRGAGLATEIPADLGDVDGLVLDQEHVAGFHRLTPERAGRSGTSSPRPSDCGRADPRGAARGSPAPGPAHSRVRHPWC